MAGFLKQHDIYGHLVSTTYGSPEVWKIPSVDFTMEHFYGDRGTPIDFVGAIRNIFGKYRKFDKPYVMAEFGIDCRACDSQYDPDGKGQNLHNALWSGVMAGGSGTPMTWWWDTYVHPKNLCGVFQPVARFVGQVNWAHTRFSPLSRIEVIPDSHTSEQFVDQEIFMGDWGVWGAGDRTQAKNKQYSIHRDGRIEGEPVLGILSGNPQGKSKLTFRLDMPAAGQFTVSLGIVSDRARLQIHVDERPQLDEPLQSGPPGTGPWKASEYDPEWKIWRARYGRDYTVQVSAGKHVVTIANREGNWLSFAGGRVTGYRSSRSPYVHALGLTSERLTLLWLQDQTSTWKTVLDKIPLKEQAGLHVAISDLASGDYRVQWWDTYQGTICAEEDVMAGAQGLVLSVPKFTRDLAALIRRSP